MVLHQAAGELRAQVWEWSRAPFEVLGLYLGLDFVEKVSFYGGQNYLNLQVKKIRSGSMF